MAKATKPKVVAEKPGFSKKGKAKRTPAKVSTRNPIDAELLARAEKSVQDIAVKLSIDLDNVAKLSANDYMALDLDRTSSVFQLTRREAKVAIYKVMVAPGSEGKFVGSHLLVSSSCKKGGKYQVSYYRSKSTGSRIDELMFRLFRDEVELSTAKKNKLRIIRICGVEGCVSPLHLELEKLSEATSRKVCQDKPLEDCIHKPVECVREPIPAEALVRPLKVAITKRPKTMVNAGTEMPPLTQQQLDVVWPKGISEQQAQHNLVIITPTKLREALAKESEQEIGNSESGTPVIESRKRTPWYKW